MGVARFLHFNNKEANKNFLFLKNRVLIFEFLRVRRRRVRFLDVQYNT